jgi:hypothetical protein
VNKLIEIYTKFKLRLAIILLFPLFWFGIKAGWNNADSDFPNYYVSAQLLKNKILHKAYDVNFFNQEIQTYNSNASGLFVMYPPTTAILALPLTSFDLLTAKRIWMIISLCAAFGIIVLLQKILNIDKVDAANLILICGFNLYNDLMLGQVYVVMIFLILAGYFCMIKENYFNAGILWGVVAAIKFLPLFFIPFLLYQKYHKVTLGLILSFVLIHIFTFNCSGKMAYISFIEVFTNNYINGQVANEIATSIQYQSVEAFTNLAIQFHQWPIWLASLLKLAWKILWICLAIITCIKYIKSSHFLSISLASIILLLLLFENGSASYHLLFSLFALVIFINLKTESAFRISLLLTFAAMGFIPVLVQFLNDQNLILHFSRLWCLSLFAVLFFIGLLKQSNFTK